MVGRVQNSVTAPDSHPSTMETKRPKLNSPHVIHETASAADGGVLFTDLPKAVQTAVRAYVDQYNAAESTCMSPRTREFLRATKSDDGYDVTFLELSLIHI